MSAADARRWAHLYAERGWRVFPVVRGGKRPMYTGWQADATTDHALIDRWWHRDPAPNIGIVTGEAFVAFDVEAAHIDTFRGWLLAQPAPLPSTPVARTGRGGIHVLARASSIGGGRDLVLDGVHIGELKARGGFIVVAPSVTTGTYGWIRSPEEVAVADAPGWLTRLEREPTASYAASCGRTVRADRALTPSRAVTIAHGLYRVVADAQEGERSDILFWAACHAAQHGLEPSAIAEILEAAALRVGLTEREARATIASGLRR